jgi:hypothetical protein
VEPAVYILATVISLVCAFLLLRAFTAVRKRLLLWSGLCFLGLSISNAIVYADLVMYPEIDLYRWRLGTAAIAMLLLLYGLIWESES